MAHTHVQYILKRTGKTWTCTAEQWEKMKRREEAGKVKLFEYIGPFTPKAVGHIAHQPEARTIGAPAEIKVVRLQGKKGAATGPSDQTA